MKFLKHRYKIFSALIIIALIIALFFINGNNNDIKDKKAGDLSTSEIITQKDSSSPAEESFTPENTEKSIPNPSVTIVEPGEENTQPSSAEIPAKPESNFRCTLSVRCDTAVGKIGQIPVTIPDDGIIFSQQEVIFYDGESVFDVLVREMKKNSIHLEFVNTPFYNSAYIEGINNLYEFDFGELSGWMYKVNGHFPNYGCSQYTLQQGDKIEWVYTCDLGKDVGGEYSARNGMQSE